MKDEDSGTIRKEVYIQCRPETLFAFFTDPAKLSRWMGRQALLEPAIGGLYRIEYNEEIAAKGEYVEVVPYEKVVLTWGWEHSRLVPPGSTTVEFRFQPQEEGTLLTVTHSGLPAEERGKHAQGWMHYTARLCLLAEGGDPGIDPWTQLSADYPDI